MARKAEPGISYYPMKTNHVTNSKVRLLFNEFDSDGYWIWSCINALIYEDKGYFVDLNKEDELELFASDVCKKKVSLVKEVINGCVRRGLYDKDVFNMFNVLTSDRIQLNYIEATSERRRKGTEIFIIKDFLLIPEDESWKNVIITSNNDILPRKNPIDPSNNPQSRVKEKETKVNPNGVPEPPASGPPILYKDIEKNKASIYKFITTYKPTDIEPYKDFWNLFAEQNGLALIKTISDTRKRKFKVRIRETAFDFSLILKKAGQSEFLRTSKWFGFDWIIENEGNYLKVVEGNYDNDKKLKNSDEQQPAGQSVNEAIKAAMAKKGQAADS